MLCLDMVGFQVLILNRTDLKRKILNNLIKTDRARWGVSGALLPTIRYSGIEFPVEAALFLVCVRVSGVDG